jgi:starvation-inducible outer membrane lipoprotein
MKGKGKIYQAEYKLYIISMLLNHTLWSLQKGVLVQILYQPYKGYAAPSARMSLPADQMLVPSTGSDT